jgi:hypothetical protein
LRTAAAAAAAVESLLLCPRVKVLLVQRRCRAPVVKAICKHNSMNAHNAPSTPCGHLRGKAQLRRLHEWLGA